MNNMAGKLNLDPQTIVDKEFDVDFKGYNPDQVDQMLDLVIEDYQTYQNMIAEYSRRLEDLERTNASLRARVIEMEGKARAGQDGDPMAGGSSNIDILKRLSRLEQKVFDENGKR